VAGDLPCAFVSRVARAGEGAEGGPRAGWSVKRPWLRGEWSANVVRGVVSGHGRGIAKAWPSSRLQLLLCWPSALTPPLALLLEAFRHGFAPLQGLRRNQLASPMPPCRVPGVKPFTGEMQAPAVDRHQTHRCPVLSRAHLLSLTPMIRDKPGRRDGTDSSTSASGGSGRTERMASVQALR